MDQFYTKRLLQLKDEFKAIEFLSTRRDRALAALDKLVESTVTKATGGNSDVEKDFYNDAADSQSKDKAVEGYYSILQGLRSVLEDFKLQVSKFPATVTGYFLEDLRNMLDKTLNPAVYKIIYDSKLNLQVGFMKDDFSIDLKRLLYLLDSLGMAADAIPREYVIGFRFLNPDNYKSANRLLLI